MACSFMLFLFLCVPIASMTSPYLFTLYPSSLRSKPTLFLFPLRHIPFLSFSSPASSPPYSKEYKFSFAPFSTKTLIPDTGLHSKPTLVSPLAIPSNVCSGGNGILKSHKLKPSPFKEKQKKKELSSEPKHSNPARRFYNQIVKEPQRLSKALAAAGVASRRSCEELVFEGKVTVNGSVCTSPQTRVDLSKDSIYVKGNRLPKRMPPKLYFALNKPKGFICSNDREKKSVFSLFDDYFKSWDKLNSGKPRPRLFTVGRLDVSTTGLIIVTNDGDFAQQISHPSSKFTKEYIATIDGAVYRRHLIAINEGTEVQGVHCVPDYVELLRAQPDAPRPRIRIVVHSGRHHEVRELVNSAGLQIHSLKRVKIGEFKLPPKLGLGKFMKLREEHLKLLNGQIQEAVER